MQYISRWKAFLNSCLRKSGAFILVVIFVSGVSAQTKPDWSKVHLLVYTKNGEGFIHDNIPNSIKAFQELSSAYGFQLTLSDEPDVFTDQNLKQFSAIVFSNTNNNVFDTEAQKTAFQHYIQSGGAFVGIHSASGTERNWPWFKSLLGGTFEWHEPAQSFEVELVDPKHVSVAHLPARFTRKKDECYYLKEMEVNLHVIAVNDLSTIDKVRERRPSTFGNKFPSVWCQEFDGGRSWYTSLGHEKGDYFDPDFQKLLMGGIEWAIGTDQNG